MNRSITSAKVFTVMTVDEARFRVVDPDGSPRFTRSRWYEVVKSDIPTVKAGRRRYITEKAFRKWLGESNGD